MPGIFIEVIIVIILVIANGVFALSEIAVISSRKARLQERARRGNKGARAALELAESPGRFLSTVQVGITLIGILAGTFGGATLARHLSAWLNTFPALASYSEALGVGLVVVAITYLSLVVGELVPKRIGLNNPEGIAAGIARPMKVLSRLASPVVWILERSGDAMISLLRIRQSEEPPVTEDEVRMLIDQGTAAGVFLPTEREMVKRVFRLADRRVDQVMTPRTRIEWLDLSEPLSALQERIRRSPRTRFPVGNGSLDEMVGVLSAKRLLGHCFTDAGSLASIEPLVEKPLFVPESMQALSLLNEFRRAAPHTAFVIDEYGSVVGMVTPTDIMEAIAGEFPTATEPVERMAVQRPDGSWLMDGMLGVDEVKDLLQASALTDEDSGGFSTLGGFVVTSLGRVPVTSDTFKSHGFRFEVVDMDGRRVDQVLVTRLPEDADRGE